MQLVKEPTPKCLVRGLFTLLSDLLRRCLRFIDVCSLEGLQPRYFFFYVAALGSTTVRAECYPAEVEPTVYLYQAAGTGPPAQPTKLQACEVWWAKTQAASWNLDLGDSCRRTPYNQREYGFLRTCTRWSTKRGQLQ